MLISHVNPRLLQADWTIFSPQANGIWAAGRVYLLDLFLIKVYIYIYIYHILIKVMSELKHTEILKT